MSTIISLVVVGMCIAATTWIVIRGGGQPATAADDDHRAERRGEPRPSARRPALPAPAVAEELEPTSEAEVLVVEPEPEPAVVPEPDRPAVPVGASRHRTPRRTRAPERVRARRRDHAGLHRAPRGEVPPLLVPSDEVPAAEPARTGLASRLRSAVVLVGIVVVVGTSVALLLGATILLVTRLLEDAVQ